MKKLLQQLASESLIYGISSMFSRFIGIFLVPLYTKVLSPSDYGTLNLVNSTFFFIIVLAVFGLDSASARWYYDTEDINERKKTISTWFWFQFSSSLIICLGIIFFSSNLSHLILQENKPILFIVPALGLLTNILPSMVTNWLRFQRKAIHTVAFTLTNIIINVSLNIWLVLFLKKGILGILISLLVSNGIASLYVIFLMREWIIPSQFNLMRLKEMLSYALPLIPTAVAFWILNSSSSFIIEHFHGKTDVGLYSIGSMVATAVTMVVGSFQMAWGPFAFSIIEKPAAKETFSMVLTLYTMLMSSMALLVALFSKEVIMIFTASEYHSSYHVAGILAFNAIIYGYAYIAIIGCNVVKDNKPLALAVLMAAATTAFLYFLLVPIFSKEGAAMSTAIGYIIVPFYLFYKSQKVWYVPFKFKISILVFSTSIVIYLVNIIFFDKLNMTLSIILKIISIFIFIAINIIILHINYPEIKNRILIMLNKNKEASL